MTAALLGQAELVLGEEKQPCFPITAQSLVIFKQGKEGVYGAASGIQGLRGQKKSLHPGKKQWIMYLRKPVKASLYDDWRCKEMTDNEGTVLAVQREKKVTVKIMHTKNARDGEFCTCLTQFVMADRGLHERIKLCCP